MTTLTFPQLETLYDELATAIDQAGPEHESVYLAKLALRMMQEFGNAPRVSELIQQCLHESPMPESGSQKLV